MSVLPRLVNSFDAGLFKSVFLLAYHASLRVGEFAKSGTDKHTLDISNVDIVPDSSKVVLTLSSFKHAKKPAKLVIPAAREVDVCPVQALKNYLSIRPPGAGHCFRRKNGSVITRQLVAKTLKACAKAAGLDYEDFDTHSFRARRTTDLVEAGYSDAIIRESGRWSSDAYLSYVRFDLFNLPGGKRRRGQGHGGWGKPDGCRVRG